MDSAVDPLHQILPVNVLSTDIEVVPITINGDQEFKLRIDGTLYGVFWTDTEARQYAKDHLPFNWDNDLSNRPPVLKSVPVTGNE